MKYRKPFDYVELLWDDANGTSPGEWSMAFDHARQLAHKHTRKISVGQVLWHDESGITIFLSRDRSEIDAHLHVPAAYIVSVRKLRAA